MDSLEFIFPTLLVAAALSFFLSGMEAGLLVLNPARIRHWMRRGRPGAAELNRLLQSPEEFLWTILVGNTLANFVLVVLGVRLLHRWSRGEPVVMLGGVLVGIFVFHAVGDLLPKMLFRGYPNRLCLALVRPFRLVHLGLGPLVGLLRWASGFITPGRGGGAKGPLSGHREELRQTLLGSHPGLTSDEQRMIGRVLDLSAVPVGQLAVELAKATTVESSTPLEEVLRVCRTRRFTRLPVWEGGAGQRRIAGVISLRTLLYQRTLDPGRRAGEFLKPALYLQEDLPVEQALVRMRRNGQRLAIVLGRNQREVGLLALDDILRFTFGELKD